MDKRPTPEQIAAARALLEEYEFFNMDDAVMNAIELLVDATAPLTDNEIASLCADTAIGRGSCVPHAQAKASYLRDLQQGDGSLYAVFVRAALRKLFGNC